MISPTLVIVIVPFFLGCNPKNKIQDIIWSIVAVTSIIMVLVSQSGNVRVKWIQARLGMELCESWWATAGIVTTQTTKKPPKNHQKTTTKPPQNHQKTTKKQPKNHQKTTQMQETDMTGWKVAEIIDAFS